MAGLKAVFLKKLSMTAYAMGRYAITRRKTRAGAVVPKIHARRSVVALMADAPSPCPPPHPAPPCFRVPPVPQPGQNTAWRLYHVRGESEVMGRQLNLDVVGMTRRHVEAVRHKTLKSIL